MVPSQDVVLNVSLTLLRLSARAPIDSSVPHQVLTALLSLADQSANAQQKLRPDRLVSCEPARSGALEGRSPLRRRTAAPTRASPRALRSDAHSCAMSLPAALPGRSGTSSIAPTGRLTRPKMPEVHERPSRGERTQGCAASEGAMFCCSRATREFLRARSHSHPRALHPDAPPTRRDSSDDMRGPCANVQRRLRRWTRPQ
jgi:hypothetical protein